MKKYQINIIILTLIIFLVVENLFGQVRSLYKSWEIDSLELIVHNEITTNFSPSELIELEYMYDNGRDQEDHKIWVWRSDSTEYFTILSGLESTIRIDTTSNQGFINSYIEEGIIEFEHYLPSASSHDFGYYLRISIAGKQKGGYIRDLRRGIDNFNYFTEEELLEIKNEREKNPLIKWVNLIDSYYLKIVSNNK